MEKENKKKDKRKINGLEMIYLSAGNKEFRNSQAYQRLREITYANQRKEDYDKP